MPDDILYIESMKDYVKVFTYPPGVIVTKQSISSVENIEIETTEVPLANCSGTG